MEINSSQSTEQKQRGRPRQFDREDALERAMLLFWEKGFEATSINNLTSIMGIAPPSLYAAFGDKKRLFLETIDLYEALIGRFPAQCLESGSSTREAIARLLMTAARAFTAPDCPAGCMIITSATNCGDEALDIIEELRRRRRTTEQLIRSRVVKGANSGEFESDDVAALAAFYVTVFQGMSVKARDGASRNELEAIAHQAMRAWPKP